MFVLIIRMQNTVNATNTLKAGNKNVIQDEKRCKKLKLQVTRLQVW